MICLSFNSWNFILNFSMLLIFKTGNLILDEVGLTDLPLEMFEIILKVSSQFRIRLKFMIQ